MDDKNNLEELKNKYNILKKKYNLPEFSELNKSFDIEEIDSNTEFLLRKIRERISEKIAGYIRFIEIILNPSNAPMFFFNLIKKLDSEDKNNLTKLYERLGKYELQLLSLDLSYEEENEAEFIKKSYEDFNEKIKEEFLKIVDKLNNEKEDSKKTNGSYFG